MVILFTRWCTQCNRQVLDACPCKGIHRLAYLQLPSLLTYHLFTTHLATWLEKRLSFIKSFTCFHATGVTVGEKTRRTWGPGRPADERRAAAAVACAQTTPAGKARATRACCSRRWSRCRLRAPLPRQRWPRPGSPAGGAACRRSPPPARNAVITTSFLMISLY